MTVKAYITRDPSGNPWPPVHEHEATAAIGLIQRLHEALDHERAFFGVFANLHVPSADLVVLTELGMGYVDGEPITATTRLKPGQHITLGGSAANDKVCDLRFTRQLPPEFQAGATAADSTTSPPSGSDESAP